MPEASSVVGIDYGVRMELSAQLLGCGRTAGSVFPTGTSYLEDVFSVSEEQEIVQLKKSMVGMKQNRGTEVISS
jgi:hypothetical protein